MVRRFVWALGVILPVAIAAYAIPKGDLLLLIAASAGLALVVAAATGNTVQRRLGFAQSPAMKVRRVYDELNEIRRPLRTARPEPDNPIKRTDWEPRLLKWDRSYWALIDDVFLAHGAYLRAKSYRVEELSEIDYKHPDAGWAFSAGKLLDQRKDHLDELLKELPKV